MPTQGQTLPGNDDWTGEDENATGVSSKFAVYVAETTRGRRSRHGGRTLASNICLLHLL